MNFRNYKQDLIFILESVAIVESILFAMLTMAFCFG